MLVTAASSAAIAAVLVVLLETIDPLGNHPGDRSDTPSAR